MIGDVIGGPGWVIRAADLKPEIIDIAVFQAGLLDDSLAELVELLWTGHPAAALAALDSLDPSPRVRALRADCHRDLGDVARAIREFDALVVECSGTPREAVMRQHRGKAHLAAGNVEHAIADFGRAVELRRDGDPALLASAEQALQFALHRAAGNRVPTGAPPR